MFTTSAFFPGGPITLVARVYVSDVYIYFALFMQFEMVSKIRMV